MHACFKPYGFLLMTFLAVNMLTAQDAGRPGRGTEERGYTPVLFLEISAVEKNGNVLLQWTTAEEHGIKEYLAEKSMDAVKFRPLAQLPAHSKTQVGMYSYTDPGVQGGVIYYRVKAIDAAGNYFLSPVKLVSPKLKPLISIFPNPLTTDAFTLHINGDKREVYQLRMFNAGGQLMMVDAILHTGGFASYSIRLPQACTGIYIIKINGARGQSANIRLVIAL